MRLRKPLCRIVVLVGLLALAFASSACDTSVGVGVGGYGYPANWGGPWTGGFIGGPIYY